MGKDNIESIAALGGLLMPIIGVMAAAYLETKWKQGPNDKAAPRKGSGAMGENISEKNMQIVLDVLGDRIDWHRQEEKRRAEERKSDENARAELRGELWKAQARVRELEAAAATKSDAPTAPAKKGGKRAA